MFLNLMKVYIYTHKELSHGVQTNVPGSDVRPYIHRNNVT